MKAPDLKNKTAEDLHKALLDVRKQQINMRFTKQAGTLEKTHEIKAARRQVARIKTLLTQKEGKK